MFLSEQTDVKDSTDVMHRKVILMMTGEKRAVEQPLQDLWVYEPNDWVK